MNQFIAIYAISWLNNTVGYSFPLHLLLYFTKNLLALIFFQHFFKCGSCGGLMVGVLDSGSSSLGSSLAEIIVSRVLAEQFPLRLTAHFFIHV